MILEFSKKWVVYFLLIFGIVVVAALRELPGGAFELHFLDVGQGDAILIKTPDNAQILVDGGENGEILMQLNEVMPFFDDSLDMIVATHPDSDHIGGLIRVLERYRVDYVLMTGIYEDEEDYFEFLKAVKANGARIVFAEAERDFAFGEVFFDVLYPFESMVMQSPVDANNTSVVMKVVFGDLRILLTGDIEEEVEKELVLAGVDLEAEILKVGHHGSKSSSGWDFLQVVRPETAVVQVGENSYGHPAQEVLDRLEEAGVKNVFRNDLDGRVSLRF